jgi:glycosyltransferase involved in cell wall biosynthesis
MIDGKLANDLSRGRGLHVVMLSYSVTEEAGGPGIAAAGFASGLARFGARVTLAALETSTGTWLIDEANARKRGFEFLRVSGTNFATRVSALVRLGGRITPGKKTVIWVNGIWGAQSLAAALISARTDWPFVVRPAGSLGESALRYKRFKKQLYFRAIESRILKRAASIHCMTEKEVQELPCWLKSKAFVVSSGVEMPPMPLNPERGPLVVGVLARIHPIKNHALALKALAELNSEGREIEVEFAGSTSDEACERRLRKQVASSPFLAGRVHFLGHVPAHRVPETVARWRAALLLSEQENLGHSVIAAASAGVPSVVSPGVGLGPELQHAGAGLVVEADRAAVALRHLLSRDRSELVRTCRRFAERFSWDSCSQNLLAHLEKPTLLKDDIGCRSFNC